MELVLSMAWPDRLQGLGLIRIREAALAALQSRRHTFTPPRQNHASEFLLRVRLGLARESSFNSTYSTSHGHVSTSPPQAGPYRTPQASSPPRLSAHMNMGSIRMCMYTNLHAHTLQQKIQCRNKIMPNFAWVCICV